MDTYFWILIKNTIALIKWLRNICQFSRRLDDIWASHLCKSQTIPTILHNVEFSVLRNTIVQCLQGSKSYVIYKRILNIKCCFKYTPLCLHLYMMEFNVSIMMRNQRRHSRPPWLTQNPKTTIHLHN